MSIGMLACTVAACSSHTAGRYLVTAAAVDLGIRGPRFCVALDPTDREGIWWWEPGSTGCASRSTGPTVFHAESAAVSTSANAITGEFRVQLITGPGSDAPGHRDVRLVVEAGRLRVPATGADVPVVRRGDLELPERVR